ncbi:hypothetical protein DFJ43DRAFT_1039992 [Lentinula guzmanii]|uniref:Uncharacterized protein n=1 Tax=Lentinula guzmanii TaxID=2804957 RepID=A0AA38JHS8_9AGAR|nr:hypothetical protein DFJ43DRAFT_1039992 [Lentinula guzmanii]
MSGRTSSCFLLCSTVNKSNFPPSVVTRPTKNSPYISALLTIGDDGAPFAHSVHAVSGRINPTAIECLVCAPNYNTGQIPELTQTTAIPAAGELEEILDATNSTRGAELLKRWAQDVNVDEFKHDPAFIAFTHLIHRRAFRKLGWRIEELLTAWGDSPFIVLKEVDFTKMKTSPTVGISLLPSEYQLLAQYFPIQQVETSQDRMIRVQYLFRIDVDNVLKWLDGFQAFFVKLRTLFPCPSRRAMNVPSSDNVRAVVVFIRLLVFIKPIIKIILSFPGAETKLLGAETVQRAKKRAKKATGKAYDAIEDFSFPFSLSYLEKKQRQKRTSTRTKNEAEDADEDQAEDEDVDELEDVDDDEADDLSDVVEGDSACECKGLFFYSVAHGKFQRRLRLQRVLTVHFYSCPPVPRTKGDPQLRAKLDQLFPNMGLTKGQKQFSKMLDHWAKAKVHAEAALMGWAFAQCEAHDPQVAALAHLSNDLINAFISKKCCYLCWRLQQKLNQTKVLQLSLPGTHNGIFAWIPPREIPEDILFQLRNELLTVLREQSSDASNNSEDDDVITSDMVSHIEHMVLR